MPPRPRARTGSSGSSTNSARGRPAGRNGDRRAGERGESCRPGDATPARPRAVARTRSPRHWSIGPNCTSRSRGETGASKTPILPWWTCDHLDLTCQRRLADCQIDLPPRSTKFSSALFTLCITPVQSPGVSCRKHRIVGYQGDLPFSWSHRDVGANGTSVHTGLPSAPARCAIIMSTVITRWTHWIKAPRFSGELMSPVKRTTLSPCGVVRMSVAGTPVWRLTSRTPAMDVSGANSEKGMDAGHWLA
jgi:hypothetical protein